MPLILLDNKSERCALRSVGTTTGSVLATFEAGRAVVWLSGPIDLAVGEDLQAIATHVIGVAPHVVVESSRMTFCDGTLGDFLSAVCSEVPVTVRRPQRTLRQLIRLWGLTGRVQIADFPGPAAPIPA